MNEGISRTAKRSCARTAAARRRAALSELEDVLDRAAASGVPPDLRRLIAAFGAAAGAFAVRQDAEGWRGVYLAGHGPGAADGVFPPHVRETLAALLRERSCAATVDGVRCMGFAQETNGSTERIALVLCGVRREIVSREVLALARVILSALRPFAGELAEAVSVAPAGRATEGAGLPANEGPRETLPAPLALRSPQRQMTETERHYRTILQSLPTCIVVLSRNGTVEDINHSPPPDEGRPPQYWLGRPVGDLPLLNLGAARVALRRLLDGARVRLDAVPARDGSGREVTCAVSGIPLLGRDGPEGAVLLIEDITERLAAEERDTFLASITQHSNDAIVSIDAQGTIQTWNAGAEALFGVAAEETIGRWWSERVPVRRRGEWNRILRLADEQSAYRQVETAVLTGMGEEEPVEVTVSVLRGRAGERVGSALMLRSVAERKRLEKSLRQAERLAAVGQLAAGVAHEINNPLTSIKNSFYIVRNALPPGGRSAEFAKIIDSEIDRISGIVNCLMDCYRPRVHSWERFSLGGVIRDCVSLMRAEIEARRLRLTLRLDEDIPPLLSSEQSVKQILINLILNGIQSMEAGGELTLETTSDGELIRVVVADTGCGIAPENMSHLFDPFFTTKQKGPGTSGMGLGLSVSLGIAETLGGFIEVESTAGAGSRFTLGLPIDASTGYRESHEQRTSVDR